MLHVYLHLCLRILLTTDEGMKDEVDGLINFAKRRALYAIISRIQSYQMQPYNFVSIPQITALMDQHAAQAHTHAHSAPLLSEEQLFALSQAREPKEVEDISELV